MTVTITYTDGSVETYTSCICYTNDGKIVQFFGKKDGESKQKVWSINWALVKKIAQDT